MWWKALRVIKAMGTPSPTWGIKVTCLSLIKWKKKKGGNYIKKIWCEIIGRENNYLGEMIMPIVGKKKKKKAVNWWSINYGWKGEILCLPKVWCQELPDTISNQTAVGCWDGLRRSSLPILKGVRGTGLAFILLRSLPAYCKIGGEHYLHAVYSARSTLHFHGAEQPNASVLLWLQPFVSAAVCCLPWSRAVTAVLLSWGAGKQECGKGSDLQSWRSMSTWGKRVGISKAPDNFE